MPVDNPTMPAFGGSDLCTLYVTSARQTTSLVNRLLHPHDGGLFALQAPAPGLPTHLASDEYFVYPAD